MNCADYRRHLAADPARIDAAGEQHRLQCAECAALTVRAQSFEQSLGEALAVAPPPGFEQTLLAAVRQQLDSNAEPLAARKPAPRRKWMPALGLAASVLLAVFASLGTWSMRPAHAMPEMAVQHVMGEEIAVLDKTTPISTADVVAGFRSRHLALGEVPPGEITYVHDCIVGGYSGIHVAMRRDNETVTVLYLLGTQRKAGDYQRDGMHVRMVPDERGTLVLLASSAAPFDAVENDWRPVINSATTIPAGAS